MIAYLITNGDGSTNGIVLADHERCDADKAEAARHFYCEQMAAQGIKSVHPVSFGVSAMFEGVTLFRMEEGQ